MNYDWLKTRFPNASEDFLQGNSDFSHDPSSRTQPEQVVCHGMATAEPGEAGHSGRVQVSVTSYRRRLADPDNLCPKYFIDCLRYSGLIRNDREQDIELRVRQKKVSKQEEQRTEIELIYL